MSITGIRISDLGAAAALDGSELVPIVQGGVTDRTTTQDIADLAGGGGSIPNVANQAVAAGVTNNLATDITTANRLRITPAGDAEVTGLAGGVDGQIIIVQNMSTAFLITLSMESVLSAVGNRWAGNGDVIIQPRCGKAFVKDTTVNRWVSL